MRRFKIRDLVIDVVPGDRGAQGRLDCPFVTCFTCTATFTCIGPTCTPFSVQCRSACSLNITTFTQDCCDSCHPAITDTGPLRALDVDDLEVLKGELEREMQAVEQRQAELNEQLRPKTVAEIDQLTAQLNAALEELASERARLEGDDD